MMKTCHREGSKKLGGQQRREEHRRISCTGSVRTTKEELQEAQRPYECESIVGGPYTTIINEVKKCGPNRRLRNLTPWGQLECQPKISPAHIRLPLPGSPSAGLCGRTCNVELKVSLFQKRHCVSCIDTQYDPICLNRLDSDFDWESTWTPSFLLHSTRLSPFNVFRAHSGHFHPAMDLHRLGDFPFLPAPRG